MASVAYGCRGLVLKKTKLGETDLIVTMLAEDGQQKRAVAKGARKPMNPFAARLELFSVCDLQLSTGRSLDVVTEARLEQANMNLRQEIDSMAAAAPVLDALDRTTHEDLPIPRLFDMSCSALAHMTSAPPNQVPGYTAAFLLKLFGMLGLRPNFQECVVCGVDVDTRSNVNHVSFSYADGGVLCTDCAAGAGSVQVEATTLQWAQTLMMSTFDDIGLMDVLPGISFSVLHLCHAWLRENMGMNLKSMNYLLSCGLF